MAPPSQGGSMRSFIFLLGSTALAAAMPVHAADALKFGPAPSWVVPQTIPKDSKPTDAAIAILLSDDQIALDPGKVTTYHDAAARIQNAQGLAAGNLSIVWDPATETVTVNKLDIIRGDKVIDVLASGQTFTTLRRETNLDAATLDGTLTATILPEDLQKGDIIELATTTEHSDPVLKGHVETSFADWNDLPIEDAHASLSWPSSMKVLLKETASVPDAHASHVGGRTIVDISGHNLDPIVPPDGAPLRFKVGRLAEATDFSSWDAVSQLMRPLFEKAAIIPASGPLHDEVEKIRAASKDPKIRATQALALVEDRVRYVALEMGQGGYVPASAETTWSRRFGDCKAKSALLLGILHSLDVAAEPVLVQADAGDIIADRPPMLDLFNHVIVRAHIAGKDYWLDGTRTGDTNLDQIRVPNFGWVLPLVKDAALVHLVPPPLDQPSQERHVTVDASAGIYAPATISIEEIYRGDRAISLNNTYSGYTADQRDSDFRDEAKKFFDTFKVASSTFDFDPAKQIFTVRIKGTATLNWKDGWSYVPTSTIAFDPDFDRAPGPQHDAPFAIDHPRFDQDIATIRLPWGVAAEQKLSTAVHETLAGVEYERSESVSDDVLTVDSSERSLVGEVPYATAIAAASRLKSLYNDDVYLGIPDDYSPSDKDLTALAAATPGSAADYVRRGNIFLDAAKYDQAAADFTQALSLDPKNAQAAADRGLTYVWKSDYADAEKDLATAAALDPDEDVMLRARGLMDERKGQCADAVKAFSQLLNKDPADAFSLAHRAQCEATENQPDQALADSAVVLKSASGWQGLRLLRANIYLRQGNHDAVQHEADLLIQDNPHNQWAVLAAAKIYAAIDQQAKAMPLFDRALAIKPTADVYLNRAQVRPDSDKAGRLADVDAALKLEPDNSDALLQKAFYLAEEGKYSEAIPFYDRAVQTDHSVEAGANRAVALYKAGRTAEAQQAFAKSRLNAETAVQLNDLCWIKATAGVLLDSALQDCRDALKLSPGTGPFLDSLGMVLLKLGKLDEALDAYNQAIAKGTGPDSLMGRAFVYARKGDSTHAKADAAEARKGSPHVDSIFAEYGLKFDDPAAPAKPAAAATTAAK